MRRRFGEKGIKDEKVKKRRRWMKMKERRIKNKEEKTRVRQGG
jgi:hypothetical protein